MDSEERRRELGRFLRDRRARLVPADVGIAEGFRRRVRGLRREEVAELAGVGVSWYTMLETGTASNVSVATLDAVCRALRLSDNERSFARRLAEIRTADPPRDEPSTLSQAALAAIEWVPAYIITSHWIVLAWNNAMSLVWNIETPGGAPFDIVRRTFEDPQFRALHGDRFPQFARALVSMVRSATAAHLEDPGYRRLCADLRSDPVFAQAWDVFEITTPVAVIGTRIDSPVLGPFTYKAITLEIPNDDGHWLVMQIPEAADAARLRALLRGTRT